MKTKGVIRFVLIGLAVLILLVMVLVGVFGDRALKMGIEKGASSALKVGVTLEDASLSLLAGSVGLKGLVVDNPEGYQHEHFLELDSAKVDVAVGSLMSDTINIEKIHFDEMTVLIEQKGLSNNLKEILSSLPKAEDKPKDEGPGKNLLISDLNLSNITVKVKLLPIPGQADTVTLKLAPIVMKDLGTEKKMDIAKLSAIILGAIAKGVAQQGAGLLPEDLTKSIGSALEASGILLEGGLEVIGEGLDAGKQVLEEGLDVGKDVLDVGKDIGEGIGDGIKGLLGGKKKEE